MREAIRRVVNAALAARLEHIWGEGTTACAADSKKFGAWDQDLMTEWHVRYGGRGVMSVNTLMLQQVREEAGRLERLRPEDRRGLSPLRYHQVNP